MHAVAEVEVRDRTSIEVSNGAGQHRPSLTLLSVRLTPPIARTDPVPRERLTTRLIESRERLVLVVAPAGYGKTTLAVQWSELDDRRFAWVVLGAGMGDPAVLWSSVAESVGRAEPTFAPTAERLESRLAAAEPSTMAAQVAEALEAIDGELVIVLDDYHFIEESASHASVASFLESCLRVSGSWSCRAGPRSPSVGSVRTATCSSCVRTARSSSRRGRRAHERDPATRSHARMPRAASRPDRGLAGRRCTRGPVASRPQRS